MGVKLRERPGETQEMLDYCTEKNIASDVDLEWTEAERFPYYGGTWHSPQAVIDKLLLPLGRDWEDFSANVDDFIAQDHRIVAFGTYSGTYRQTGRFMSSPFAHVVDSA